MNTVTYRLETEQDLQRIVSSLEQSKIPYSVRKYTDSAFPFIVQSKGFGDITISAERETELQSLIETLTNTKPLRVDSYWDSGRGRNIWRNMFIAYTVIITVMCGRYWYLNYRTSEDKNNTFEWSFDGQDLTMRSKNTGVISHMYTDANFDQNYELSIAFSKYGVRTAMWRDLNEDGYYEEPFFYDLKGEPTGFQFDRDNDGVVEQATIVLDSNDTLNFTDADKDGIWELENAID